jgi:hypothetical protein
VSRAIGGAVLVALLVALVILLIWSYPEWAGR